MQRWLTVCRGVCGGCVQTLYRSLFAALPGSLLLHAAFSSRGEWSRFASPTLPSSRNCPYSTSDHIPLLPACPLLCCMPLPSGALLPSLISSAQIPRSPISAALSAAPAPLCPVLLPAPPAWAQAALVWFILSLFSSHHRLPRVTGGEVHAVLQLKKPS